MNEKKWESAKDDIFAYEPKPIPLLDADGNIIGYDYPKVLPCTLEESDDLRVKSFPNELGCSADPKDVQGFQATLDVVNANRNTKTSGLSPIGKDECDATRQVSDAFSNFSKELSNCSKDEK